MARKQINTSAGAPPTPNETEKSYYSAEQVTTIVNNATQPIKDDLNDYKIKIVEMLAIFVALFTFVSVDIQIFKSAISTLPALGFTLVMLGALLLFVVMLSRLLNSRDNKDKESLLKWNMIIAVCLIVTGIVVVGWDFKGLKDTINNDFYTKEQVDNNILSSVAQTKNQLDNFKKCLKDKKYWQYEQCFK